MKKTLCGLVMAAFTLAAVAPASAAAVAPRAAGETSIVLIQDAPKPAQKKQTAQKKAPAKKQTAEKKAPAKKQTAKKAPAKKPTPTA